MPSNGRSRAKDANKNNVASLLNDMGVSLAGNVITESVVDCAHIMETFAWLEQTALSVWIRESPSMFAFPHFLVWHAIGMGFLAGACIALDLRVLGFARGVPLSSLEKIFPVMWVGLVFNAASGILLLLGYPTKALTNPLFYVKLASIAAGIGIAVGLRSTVVRNPLLDSGWLPLKAKVIALVSIALWIVAITAGRFLAYTCTYLMAGSPC